VTEQAIVSSDKRQAPKGNMSALALSALGIVFGDIGTSPLYTFKTVLGTAEMPSDPAWARSRWCCGRCSSSPP
jgi:KUP system potassium uptake protein